MLKPQPRTVVKLAFAGFVVTLLALVVHVYWSVRSSSHALDEIIQASTINSAYDTALAAVARAELHGTRFIISPNPVDRAQYDTAVREGLEATSLIANHGSSEETARMKELNAEYAPRLFTARANFEAISRGEQLGIVPETSVISDVQERLRQEVQRSQANVVALLSDYQTGQRNQLLLGAAGFTLGLPIMLAFMLVIRHYQRREGYAEVEMRRLEHAALTDSLTGQGNHRAFQEQLTREVAQARLDSDLLCLALVDVDRFKDVNDSEGHAKGDEVLLSLGSLLQKAVGRSSVFRIGGDEFALILPSWSQDTAQGCLESLRLLASETLGGCTLSIGLAVFEEDDDGEILREKADIALYLAKRRGRNAVCVYAGENGVSSPVTQAKMNALRFLLQYASVDVAFQPVFTTHGDHLVGYEALARIPKRFGLSGPQEAFDIAERLGRSFDLDMICLRAVLSRAKAVTRDSILFINLSPRSLEHAAFSIPELQRLVRDAGLMPSRICFELTERSTASIELVKSMVERLRSAGFAIALDDVGSGNSGLEMLRTIPVEYVKIDRTVVADAVQPGPGRAVLMAIVAFASEAGAFVIAEGIEEEEMLLLVHDTSQRVGNFRIQGVQGNLLGRPLETIAPVQQPVSLAA